MGNTFSSSSSYLQYTNDFELVVRATKDLEHLLVTQCNAPSGKGVGVHDKITYAQHDLDLSPGTVKKLRYLVTLRNRLVHEHGFNKLPDRKGFATSYQQAEQELKDKIAAKYHPTNSNCVIS